VVIILLVTFLVWKTRILSRCRQSWHRHDTENPPPRKPNYYHPTPGLVERASGGEAKPVSAGEPKELTLSTSELESIADSGGELQETDSGVGSATPGTPKKSITVLTEDWNECYQELASTLAKLHQLQLTDLTGTIQDVDFNAYSLVISHALMDPLFERLYVVWEGSLELKRSQPADPFKLPLLNIINFLESRSNEKEKIVFVQLGSSLRTLSRNSIKTICLEETANPTRCSGRKCAKKIFTDVQQLVAEGTDDRRMASKSVPALKERTAEVHQQATSSWPGNRRTQPHSPATRPERGGSNAEMAVVFSQFANNVTTALVKIADNTSSFGDIAHNTKRLADTCAQIADNTGQTADSVRQTADNTRQTATNSGQIADSIGQVACSTRQMAEDARVTRNLVEETHDLAEQTSKWRVVVHSR